MRPITLGLTLLDNPPTVAELVEQARIAEAIGFQAISLPDHLGMTAPLVPLVAIAQAAPTVQVSNLVLNAAFYRPALLARDLASVDPATGGRLIIALGTGHAATEFASAGLPFPHVESKVRVPATVLDGSVAAAADRIRRYHHELGISLINLSKTAGTTREILEKLAAALR